MRSLVMLVSAIGLVAVMCMPVDAGGFRVEKNSEVKAQCCTQGLVCNVIRCKCVGKCICDIKCEKVTKNCEPQDACCSKIKCKKHFKKLFHRCRCCS